MKREKIPAEALSKKIGISAVSLRRMLRGEIKMDADVYRDAVDAMGYKIIVVKKEDIL